MRIAQLREFTVTLRSNPYATYTLKPMENPSELQRQIYKSWLGLR
jgi:hypothetical protein